MLLSGTRFSSTEIVVVVVVVVVASPVTSGWYTVTAAPLALRLLKRLT